VPLSFISVLDEAGSPIATYPKIDMGRFLGAVISAVTQALGELGSQSIEHISTDRFHIYTYKTDRDLLLLITFRKEGNIEPRKDLINWFLYNLSLLVDRIYESDSLEIILVEESKGSPIDPLLENVFRIFNEIESLFRNLVETYHISYKVFGEIAKRLVETNIERLKLPLRVENNELLFREVKSDFAMVKESLNELIRILNEKFKELT